MNFFLTLHCLQGLRTLYRLSIFDEAGWDRQAVRRTADVMAYLNHFVGLTEKIHCQFADGSAAEYHMWSNSRDKLKSVIPLWKAGLDKADGIVDRGIDASEEPVIDPILMDFLDDTWFVL